MGIELMLNYFIRYGLIFLFIVVFLENLNCPGIPATVVMPTIGAFVAVPAPVPVFPALYPVLLF